MLVFKDEQRCGNWILVHVSGIELSCRATLDICELIESSSELSTDLPEERVLDDPRGAFSEEGGSLYPFLSGLGGDSRTRALLGVFLGGIGVSFLSSFLRQHWARYSSKGAETLLGGVKGAGARRSMPDPMLLRRLSVGRD